MKQEAKHVEESERELKHMVEIKSKIQETHSSATKEKCIETRSHTSSSMTRSG